MTRDLARKISDAARALATREIRFEFERIPIRVTGASYRKIFNWLLTEGAIAFRRTEPWGWPTFLQVEPTTLCNLRCSYCPASEPTDRPKGHIDRALFERFVDEMGEYALLLVLWGWGEPFVNPEIYDLVAYANGRGIRSISSTNGHCFADPEQARRVVASGLDALIVSTVGITQESYARFRQGRADAPLEGIRRIAEEKERQGSTTPLVSLTLVVTKHSEHETELAREVAASVGADMLSFKKVNPCSRYRDGEPNREPLPADARWSRFQYDGVDPDPLRVERNPCKALWQKTNLRWDGRVNSCTFDFEGVSALGDLRSATFRDIWRGEAYRAMRRRFRKDWQGIRICDRCTYAFVGGNYTDIIAESTFFPSGAPGDGPPRRRADRR